MTGVSCEYGDRQPGQAVHILRLEPRYRSKVAENVGIMRDPERNIHPEGTMAAVVEISPPPVPTEAFERFPGRWVAIRGGEIVADAGTPEELEADERVDVADTLFRVPEPGSKFL
jgi:hypothetical protein